MKYAYLMVKTGEARRAVATGSELASTFMRSRHFSAESAESVDAATKHPELAFEKDFLRWMLSDGAGAVLLAGTPNPHGLSLRIDWIEGTSLAHELPVCMYSGSVKQADGQLRGWREAPHLDDVVREHSRSSQQAKRILDNPFYKNVASRLSGSQEYMAAEKLYALDHDEQIGRAHV